MKENTYYSIESKMLFGCLAILLVVSIFLISGCDKDNNLGSSRTEIIIVAPKLELSGTLPPTNNKVNVMVATKENSDKKYYLHIRRIEGFEYSEGYEYKLKVLITTIKNPPMDGHLETFKLLEIISKTKQSE